MIYAVDWTNVIVAGIAGLPAIIAAVFAGIIRRDIKTPSGGKLGAVVERAHDMTNANFALLRKVADKNGVEEDDK